MFGPSSRSSTSVMPYQLTMAETLSCSGPGHSRSRPAEAGSIPVVSARCPPAELPVTTRLFVSKLYVVALCITQRRAHRQSSTAAGARETRGEAILDVDHAPAFFKIIHEGENACFFRAAG